MDEQRGEDLIGDDHPVDAAAVPACVAYLTPAPPDKFDIATDFDVSLADLVEQLREVARRKAAIHAEELSLVARFAGEVEARALHDLAAGPRVSGQPPDFLVADAAVSDELMAALGISRTRAGSLAALGVRLVRVLGDTHRALAAGRIDLDRATVLAAATEVLADTAAREVEARMLAGAGDSAWAGPSPRAWRTRVDRAVTGVDPDAARRRRQEAVADRAVRAFGLGDGTGLLQIRAADTTIAVADQVITDLAHRWPTVGPDGTVLSMDQRRVDAVMDLFHRARDGRELPTVAVRREREIGLVLHTDTLLGDGPAASDPGELRGLGAPVPVDPTTARELARQDIARGTAVQVLLADHGVLRRVVRLRHAQPGGCTRAALITAVRDRLGELSPLVRDRHDPTVAIAEHVRARNPLCTSYDCPRTAQRCDLDHDTPWPRGPTDAANLCPRCRRHHELKTRRLVRTRLQSDGTVVTTMLTGIQATTRPEPLPGHDVGEGYGPAA